VCQYIAAGSATVNVFFQTDSFSVRWRARGLVIGGRSFQTLLRHPRSDERSPVCDQRRASRRTAARSRPADWCRPWPPIYIVAEPLEEQPHVQCQA
jgi:hypothetical protein